MWLIGFASMVMNDQHQSDDQKNRQTAVNSLIKKLPEKFVPGLHWILLISAVINFTMMIIGYMHLHKCPVNKYIPIFLIAIGANGVMSKFLSYISGRLSRYVQTVYIICGFYIAETVFFFIGTYWVYREFQPSYNSKDGRLYCDKTVYWVAFSYLTVFYSLGIITVFGFCCFVCCLGFVAKDTTDVELQPNVNDSNKNGIEPEAQHV